MLQYQVVDTSVVWFNIWSDGHYNNLGKRNTKLIADNSVVLFRN